MDQQRALFTAERLEALAVGLHALSSATGAWDQLDDASRAADRAAAAGIPHHVAALGLNVGSYVARRTAVCFLGTKWRSWRTSNRSRLSTLRTRQRNAGSTVQPG